jgi:SRSO17 transposase
MSMDRRFEARKQELLDDCQVSPEVFSGMMNRLEKFAEPFVERLVRVEQKEHARTYFRGLLSDLDQKNSEAIAYRHDQDRMGLQLFIGCSPWDHKPLLGELVSQVGRELGEADGVLSLDPSGFPKKGNKSVGVQRQWCGRLGKVENCQVGVFMGYASRKEQTLVNMRLYLPKQWARDKRRRKECGVPKDARYQTRHQLALEMLAESGGSLPHAWVTGDDEMGRPYRFRRDLNDLGEQYLLAVPSNTLIRDLEADPPPYRGRGTRPQVPFQRVSKWCAALPEEAWTRLKVRDGEKGPLEVDIIKCRVSARTDRHQVAPPETLVVIRWRDEEGTLKVDYHLSNAAIDTPLEEFARVSKMHSGIEQCIKRSKSEAGMAQYQVRSWNGWHHHLTLSLIATWFLVQESRRGGKMDAGDYGPPDQRRPVAAAAPGSSLQHRGAHRQRPHALAGAN